MMLFLCLIHAPLVWPKVPLLSERGEGFFLLLSKIQTVPLRSQSVGIVVFEFIFVNSSSRSLVDLRLRFEARE
ncbi:hypothetical protein DL95DRAFT_378394, partial [Leptodontidium sp. 2 PMI_412]